MTITKTLNGTTLVVAVEGRLDMNNSPIFEKELMGSLDGITELVLDFEKLDYIASSGLRALLLLHRSLPYKAETRIINANEIVKEVFEVTGFSNVISIQ